MPFVVYCMAILPLLVAFLYRSSFWWRYCLFILFDDCEISDSEKNDRDERGQSECTKKHNRDVMTKEAKKGWDGLQFSDAGCATLRLTASRQIAVPEI